MARNRVLVASAWLWVVLVLAGYLVQFRAIAGQLIHRLLSAVS